MIRQALKLREALDAYAFKLRLLKEDLNKETHLNDYLSDDDQRTLKIIKEQLEPLFYLTKELEGNTDLADGACRASHGALQETLPVFDHVLAYFEKLEQQAKSGLFNDHPSIQNSITLAWNTAKKWYTKTDASIMWIASLVLYPRWKWAYFEKNWTGQIATYVDSGKRKLKNLQETSYKSETVARATQSPKPKRQTLYLESILDQVALTTVARPRPSGRRDQLYWYLQELPVGNMGVMEYWRSREFEWPQLVSMAFDFLAVPAISLECERVFSSYVKQTTLESSRLIGKMLWYQECLKNWQRRGAIQIARAQNAVLLDL